MLDNLSGSATRSTRLIEKIEIRGSESQNTRAGSDTALYLVNYANNGGFALLSADRRLPHVLAFSDEGNMEFADTLENLGLANFMNMVDAGLASLNSLPDTAWLNPPSDPYLLYRNNYDIITPKLKKEMSRLDQLAPFNEYCPTLSNGEKAYAGCVPVAYAMFCSFYKWPSSYKGEEFPWDEMRENRYHDKMYRFLSVLGSSSLLNARYEDGETQVDLINFISTIRKLGYSIDGGLLNFDPEEVFGVLTRGGMTSHPSIGTPVLVRGVNTSDKGHTWVIDGALKQKLYRPTTNPANPKYDPNIPMYYFHCVWGWSGKNNGFFNYDVNALGYLPDFLGPNDEEPERASHFFTKDLQYIGRVDPQYK